MDTSVPTQSRACAGEDTVPPGAIDARTFELVITKPATGFPVPAAARAQQLRQIFSQSTGLTARFIVTEVSYDGQNGNAIFRITFKTNPDHAILAHNVEAALERLTPERIVKVVADGTGLQSELITVTPRQQV